ncbi:MAG: S8 family serine peptidase [Candidatus Methanoperedens sp.]
MKIGKRIVLNALIVTVLLIAVVLVPAMGANPIMKQTKSEKALEYISQKHVIPKERLTITNEKEANFPLINQTMWSVNILDPQTKEFYYVDIDEAGNIADIKAVKAQEYSKYREKYGKKEIELHEKLQKMNPDDTVEVGIWLSPLKDTPKPEREIGEKEYKEILDTKRNALKQKEKPVIDALIAKNINIRYASQYAPLIYAQIPAKLMDEIENMPEVDGIYVAREFKPLLNMVAQTERAQPVWNAGITGSGVKVAVVEPGKIKSSHQNLATGSSYDPSYGDDLHATEVAGIIAAINNATYKGISYGVSGLLSANFGPATSGMESRAIAASEWAINNGANILSNSWGNNTYGTMSGIDKYFDHVIWSNYKTVTVAAGNNYAGENWRVQSPGLGYNVITVGGFDDKDTTNWLDDIIWSNSAYVDPISQNGDREKPEVAAVATHGTRTIKTTQPFSPWIGSVLNAGTSYAAPAVAGEAALLMQVYSNFKNWPEVIKAIIMASADHNIEGDSRLSEKDGVGGIDINKAYETGSRALGMTTSAGNFPEHLSLTATTGQKVRVVITWDSHPDNNHPPTSDTLQSDLNLVVYSPSGAAVGTSSSFDNNYEIVEFTAPSTGTYDATVYARRFEGAYEYLGFAYTYV